MELSITSLTIVDESGRPRSYHYSLLVDQIKAGRFTCEDYGVQIREEKGDCVNIPNITTSTARINALMNLLVKHAVTPAALPDVVADWL